MVNTLKHHLIVLSWTHPASRGTFLAELFSEKYPYAALGTSRRLSSWLTLCVRTFQLWKLCQIPTYQSRRNMVHLNHGLENEFQSTVITYLMPLFWFDLDSKGSYLGKKSTLKEIWVLCSEGSFSTKDCECALAILYFWPMWLIIPTLSCTFISTIY